LYSIPGEYERYFSNNEQVAVQVPLGAPVASTVDRYIPLDAVYQTQEAAFVYLAVVADGKTVARVRQVELGSVSGGYVAVNSGLADDEKVIITRGMTDGEIVSIQ
jgi:multidrug efflux pump subunit AcrA (membrane-fusion protein)